MTINDLSKLKENQSDNLLPESALDSKNIDWLDQDPEFIELLEKSNAVDELVVMTYEAWLEAENKPQEKAAYKNAKKQQTFIRQQLIEYMFRALNKH